ncbi:hypothetical protein [Fusobacterium polymorphum]|uniref:Uncharacterized protein n=1 Tax=Fusobacterium nucleatum subsp. polymorphum TaxID=76857 RepID=A0A241Q2K7_FUSNP|nr:hypothetical protein [Fusobacterium polymorphum]ASG29052.1 hypothetical protein CBG61_09215 [Fusobacterium polymorphum]
MREELYQKEIKDLTQDELYEILLDCGISSVHKVKPGQGEVVFLDNLESKEEASEIENQGKFIYYRILDKLDNLDISKNDKVGYKLSCSVESSVNYKLSNDYKVA